MPQILNFATFDINLYESCLENIMFLPFIILEIFTISQSEISNPQWFHTKHGNIELLLWYQYETFTNYLSSQEETKNLNILIEDVISQNSKLKSKNFTFYLIVVP